MSERGECSKSNSAAVPEADGSVVNVEDLDLLTAVKEGNVSFVKTLLEVGTSTCRSATVVDVDAVPELDAGFEFTALHQAVSKGLHLAAAAGNDEMLDVLLDLHPNVNTQGERKRTPLNTYAVSQGASLHVIKKFLEGGADPNVPDEYGHTCLHTAIYAGNMQMMRHLLNPEIYSNSKMLVDINAVANGRMTVLHIAVKSRREDVILEVLNHSPDVNIRDLWGSTALHLYLSGEGGSEELRIVRKFLQLGADLRIVDANKRDVLHVAVLENKLYVVKCLLDSDLARGKPETPLDINAVDKYGLSALHLAVKGGNHDMVMTILSHDQYQPDMDICSVEGDTAFDIYCRQRRDTKDMRDPEAVKLFLRHGANVNPSSGKYCNSLRFDGVPRWFYPDVLRCLLEPSNYRKPQYRLDPNALDEGGLTPLHHTVGSFRLNRRPETTIVMKELLKHGADPNIRTQLGWFVPESNTKWLWTPPENIDVPNAHRMLLFVRLVKRDEGLTALHISAVNGLRDAVEVLLANGAGVDALDSLGMTALMLSIGRDDQEMVKLLLQHRARVSITGPQGHNCLHIAAARGLSCILKDILEASKRLGEIAIINSVDENGATALHHAAEKGYNDAVEVLLDYNACVNVRDSRGMSPLMVYFRNSAATDRLVRKFLQHGASLSITTPEGKNCLHIAAAGGVSSVVKAILEASNRLGEISIINSTDENGATALHHAAEEGYNDAVEVLLDHNADVNVRDSRGMSPLMLYIRNGLRLYRRNSAAADGLVRRFMQHGASLSITTPEGKNCLHIAAAGGVSSVEKAILEASNRLGEISIINSTDENGATALHHAAEEGYNDAVEVLLDHNADVNDRDSRGMSPLMLYVRNSGATGRLAHTFLERGADFSVLDMKKQNLLHVAAMSGACGVVKALLGSSSLEKLFDVNSVDEDGSTSLHLAADNHHHSVLRELLDHGPDMNICDRKGDTPLILYCRSYSSPSSTTTGMVKESLDMVKEFIKHGAKLEILNEEKQGCLHAATGSRVSKPKDSVSGRFWNRDAEHEYNTEQYAPSFVSGLIELLVSGGVEEVVGVNAIDVHGMTPLHLAAAHGDGLVLTKLLNDKAKVNLQDSRGKTSLHYYLVAKNYREVDSRVVERFLAVGANPSILDENGHNCLHAAVMSGDWELVTCLMEACSKFRCALDVDAADKEGSTALHLAVAATDFPWKIPQMVKTLLKYNLSVNIRNKKGETPLQVYRKAAGRDSNSRVVEMLRDLGAKDEVDRLGQVDELLPEKYEKDPIFRNEVEDDTSVDGQEELSNDEDRRRRIKQRKRTKRFMSFQRQTGAISLMRRCPQAGTEPRYIPTSSEEEPEEPEDAVDMEDPERTLRSDALALGFQGFDDPFDCARVLFVVVKSGEDVEISFFHHEGMMLFFGLGLRFSKVLLRGSSIDNSIEVQELERTTWMECWSNNQIGSLVVYDREQGIEGFLQDLQSADGGSKDSLLSPKNHQLPILDDLQSYLSPFGSMLSSGIRFMIGSNGSSTSETPGTLNNAQPGAGHPGAGLAVQGETTDSVVEDKSGKFELTVKVWLRSEDTDNTKREPLEINEHEPELKHYMEPVLTIKFVFEKDGDFIRKTFHTTLDLQFHMDKNGRSNTNPKVRKFGWFHNDLEMSFRCSDSDAVSLENPVMLDVESRTGEQVVGTDQSIETKKGNQGNVGLTMGPRDLGTAQMAFTVSNEKATAVKKTHQQTESRTQSYLPETTFEVNRCGAPAKLAYSGSLADSYDATNREDWEYIRKNGGVKTVSFRAEGKWTVDNTAENPCEYHFTGNRNLYMVVLAEIPLRRPRIITWLPFRKRTTRKPLMITVQQEIAKTFYIDHSFSCVERLALQQRNHELEWRLGRIPEAPADVRDVINTVRRG